MNSTSPHDLNSSTYRPHSLIPYYGGKWALAPWIISQMPPHHTLVDVFGGSGAILLRKAPPSPVEVYNDRDEALVNIFRVIRDPADRQELLDQLSWTPHARAEFNLCHAGLHEPGLDPIEWARRALVVFRQGYGGVATCRSWATAKTSPKPFRALLDNLEGIAERFAEVQVECLDFAELIPLYDSPDTLFYCDPPYHPDIRSRPHTYRHEMSAARHEELLDILDQVQGKVLLSGYGHPLYDEKLAHWGRTERSNRMGVSKGTSQPHRVEVLWKNFQTPLFDISDSTSPDAAPCFCTSSIVSDNRGGKGERS